MSPSHKTRFVLAVAICLISIGILAALLYLPIPEPNRSAIDILLGGITATMGMVFTYYFGSSDSSHQKNEVIANAFNKTQKQVDDVLPPYTEEELNDFKDLLNKREKP